MSSIILTASRKYPSLPTVGGDVTSHTKVLEALRDAVQTHERRTSDKRSSFVRVQDLIDLGAARLLSNNRLEWLGSPSSGGGGGGATLLSDLEDVDLAGLVDGDTLVYDAAYGLWLPEAPATGGGGGGGALEFIKTATVAGANATTLTVSGLDLDTDIEYLVRFEMLSANAAQQDVSMYYNADTTAGNYDSQLGVIDNTFAGAQRYNAGVVGSAPGGAGVAIGDWTVNIRRALDGRVYAHWRVNRSDGSGAQNIDFEWGSHKWRTANTNVTGITFSIAAASALTVGSYAKVWKLTG